MSFRFAIGDVVQLNHELLVDSKAHLPMTVIERHAVECHGGTQYLYALRPHGTIELVQNVCDFELEPYTPRDGNEVLALLQSAKEESVAKQDWQTATEIKQITDRLKSS